MNKPNYRKNIVKAYHQEVHRLKELNKEVSYSEEEFELIRQKINISKARIKLLKDLQHPLKEHYELD